MAEAKESQEKRSVTEVVRTVLLAGIGALALTKEEVEQIVNRLVERGELAEKDARRVLEDLWSRRRQEVDRWAGRLEERLEKALERLNVPRREDLDALEKRLAALERKLDALSERLDARGGEE